MVRLPARVAMLATMRMVVTVAMGTSAAVLALHPGVSVAKTPSLHYSQAYTGAFAVVVRQMDYPVGPYLAALGTLAAYQHWYPDPLSLLPRLLHLSRTLHSFCRAVAMPHHNLDRELHYRVSLCCKNYRASLFIHLYVYRVVPCVLTSCQPASHPIYPIYPLLSQ